MDEIDIDKFVTALAQHAENVVNRKLTEAKTDDEANRYIHRFARARSVIRLLQEEAQDILADRRIELGL